MAKGRKTKRAGRGKTKTPKASKALKSPKKDQNILERKERFQEKRSLKGGMFSSRRDREEPEFRRC